MEKITLTPHAITLSRHLNDYLKKEKLKPLGDAAENGYLDIVRVLIEATGEVDAILSGMRQKMVKRERLISR